MRVNGQIIVDLGTHYLLKLQQPYWDAWQEYGWEGRIEGLGVSEALVSKAEANYKRIKIVFPYGEYETSTKKIRELSAEYKSTYIARNGSKILVTPRSGWNKVSGPGFRKDGTKRETKREKEIREMGDRMPKLF